MQLCLSICAAQALTDAAVLKIMTVCSVELTAGVTARPCLRQEAVERRTARMVQCLLDARRVVRLKPPREILSTSR